MYVTFKIKPILNYSKGFKHYFNEYKILKHII